jgi:hypothetical protein
VLIIKVHIIGVKTGGWVGFLFFVIRGTAKRNQNNALGIES